jgi:CBS domain-containing protein
MQAKDASRKMPVTVPADRSVAEVAKLMDEVAVGAVVIVDDEKPVGIVTDRDLAVRALARKLPPDSRVDAVMSTSVVTLGATADLRDAVRIFTEHAFRRLPLVEKGRMVGMLTVDDLLIDVVSDLANLVRPITGEVIFGHPEPTLPAERS